MGVSQDNVGNRVVIPGRLVRNTEEVARVSQPGQSLPQEPRVEMIRIGDEVQAIEVTCACGQRIRLRCVYQDQVPG